MVIVSSRNLTQNVASGSSAGASRSEMGAISGSSVEASSTGFVGTLPKASEAATIGGSSVAEAGSASNLSRSEAAAVGGSSVGSSSVGEVMVSKASSTGLAWRPSMKTVEVLKALGDSVQLNDEVKTCHVILMCLVTDG